MTTGTKRTERTASYFPKVGYQLPQVANEKGLASCQIFSSATRSSDWLRFSGKIISASAYDRQFWSELEVKLRLVENLMAARCQTKCKDKLQHCKSTIVLFIFF